MFRNCFRQVRRSLTSATGTPHNGNGNASKGSFFHDLNQNWRAYGFIAGVAGGTLTGINYMIVVQVKTLEKEIGSLEKSMDGRFQSIDKQLEGVKQQFDGRFQSIDKQLEGVNGRFNEMFAYIIRVEDRYAQQGERLAKIETLKSKST